MSTKYWDLYVYYVKKCVRENYINDLDPNHYEMEFNHFWPKCIFGAWPVGQWLTKKQHAIASALQTLAFNRNCMYGKHKRYLPAKLLKLVWPHFCEQSRKTVSKLHEEKDEKGRSLLALRSHREKDEQGRSILALNSVRKIHERKDERGKSLTAVKAGRSVVESGAIQITHEACRKPVCVTSENGEVLYFQSIKETGEYFSTAQNSIGAFIASGKFVKKGKCKGHRFELADEM